MERHKYSTAQGLLKYAGTWVGDDLEECLEQIRRSRIPANFGRPGIQDTDSKCRGINMKPHSKHRNENKLLILRLFRAGESQIFEDGMESEFSRSLVRTIRDYGSDAISIISDLILNEIVNPEVASEALRWIGYMDDPETHVVRLNLLTRCLNHSHPWVRDGASLGLAYLDDPSAIASLEAAIEREKYELLRKNMIVAIEDLQERS